MKGIIIDRKKDIFQMLIPSPHGYKNQDWAKLKPRARILSWSSRWVVGRQGLEPSSADFPRVLTGSSGKLSSQGLNQYSWWDSKVTINGVNLGEIMTGPNDGNIHHAMWDPWQMIIYWRKKGALLWKKYNYIFFKMILASLN